MSESSPTRTIALAVGVLLWTAALLRTPNEIEAARKREPIGARTAVTMVAYLAAAVLVLSGLSKKKD